MATPCTHCEAGFLNLHQVDEATLQEFNRTGEEKVIFAWMEANLPHDVAVCDCCGDGEGWYGIPGEHYNSDDPPGRTGPYAYNGGLCECH